MLFVSILTVLIAAVPIPHYDGDWTTSTGIYQSFDGEPDFPQGPFDTDASQFSAIGNAGP